MIKKIIKAFPILILGLLISPISALAQTAQGTLGFSPATVKNGSTFNITLSGGFANTDTKIWVDNNDGKGFRDFGGWLKTDASGNINVSRTLNCNSYQTLEPNQTVPIGSRKLVQKVYLEFVGLNKISSTATHTKDCLASDDKPVNPTIPKITPDTTFPSGETSYTVTTSKGPVSAAFKYAPAITGAIFNQQNIGTYMGNKFKNIVWIPNGYPGGAGPAGRWNISDPWNPTNGGVAGLASGGSALAVGTQPATHKGPFHTGSYPHSPSLSYGGGALGESATGQGRFVFDFGQDCSIITCRNIAPVLTLAQGQGMSIGQLLEEHVFTSANVFGNETEKEGRTVVDATAAGRFIMFSGGGVNSQNQPRALEIFDTTNLSGSYAFGANTLKPISSEGWPNITELQIVEVPNTRNHFLIARSSAPDITTRPTFYIGEISAETGNIIRQNSFSLEIQGTSYGAPYSPGARIFPGSGLEYASVNGKTYVFMNENFTRQSFDANALFSLKIGAYEFNPQSLTFTRRGDITLNNMPRKPLGSSSAWDVYFRIARAQNNDTYPMLAAWSKYKAPLAYAPQLYSLDLYSLKDVLSTSTPRSIIPVADVSIQEEDVKRPLSLGQIELAHYAFDTSSASGGSPYHLFIKKEGTKNNLYLYRRAFLFDGRAHGGSGGVYDYVPAGLDAAGDERHYYGPFMGKTTLRVDKIDVTGFTGGAFTPATPTDPVTPGGGGEDYKALLDQPCATTFAGNSALIGLCQQVKFVQKRSCSLVPGLSFCYGFKESN